MTDHGAALVGAMTPAEHIEPIWSLLAEAVERTGHVTVADHDTARCVAVNALAALHAAGYVVVPDEPDHIIELRDDDWTLQHSLTCRLDNLFDCPTHRAIKQHLVRSGPPPERGRFVVTLRREVNPVRELPVLTPCPDRGEPR